MPFQRGLEESAPARLVDDELLVPEILKPARQQQFRIHPDAWVREQLLRELRSIGVGVEDPLTLLDRPPPAEVDVAPVASVEADDVDDRSSCGPERFHERTDVGERRRGPWNLERLAVEHVALRVDGEEGAQR